VNQNGDHHLQPHWAIEHGTCLNVDHGVYHQLMPNQRAKNKVLIGAFVDAQLKTRVVRLAEQKGITTSDILGEALRHYLDDESRAAVASPAANPTTPTVTSAKEPEPEGKDEVWLL
jgi:hypothetical protein